ncbi:MAG: CDP-glycerol glycerophosphotransferase family protein [Methanobacterium sp.]|nr:CDP-glycerol glycerophosphotransferase family protein [Methanobacterium sp.]
MNNKFFFKCIGYFIMAISFYLNYLFPINDKKILLIMTHDTSEEGNVGSTYQYFKQQDQDLKFKKITRENYTFVLNKNLFKNLIYMFIKIPYHIVTSKIIFMDNVFLPFAFIKVKKNTHLVQLWHGTGTLKKFGLDTEAGWVKKLAKAANNNTNYFIVGSHYMKEIYKTAFGAGDDKIVNIGCPRTDMFFNKNLIQEKKEEFFKVYPDLFGKKIILYAPTFRNNENMSEEIKINLDIHKLIYSLDEKYILGLRLHPHLADRFNLNKNSYGSSNPRVIDFSNYEKLNTLLISCDILITDYSSIIYEYALMEKPMIFYCYDLDKYEKLDRGFYGNYKSIVPGPIAFQTEEIVNIINNPQTNDNIESFLNTYLQNCEGKSRRRLYNFLMNTKK